MKKNRSRKRKIIFGIGSRNKWRVVRKKIDAVCIRRSSWRNKRIWTLFLPIICGGIRDRSRVLVGSRVRTNRSVRSARSHDRSCEKFRWIFWNCLRSYQKPLIIHQCDMWSGDLRDWRKLRRSIWWSIKLESYGWWVAMHFRAKQGQAILAGIRWLTEGLGDISSITLPRWKKRKVKQWKK